MGSPNLIRWTEQAAGALLIALVLLDAFLSVLYARIDSGIISYRLARVVWWLFRRVAMLRKQSRAKILSFCGPAILVALVSVWATALTLGAGLLIHPRLGTSVVAETGPTPTDFLSALYAGGSSMAIVGAGDFHPVTSSYRLLYLFNSLVGVSVLSLTLAYILQIYTALQRRNTLGLNIYLHTARTGDAAELLAGLGPQGHFDITYSSLAELATEVAAAKESHHFYPVLFYFRFSEPYYSVSLITTVALDSVSLAKSALDDREYRWLKDSGALAQLWEASLLMITTLENTFLAREPRSGSHPPDAETIRSWRDRYFAAVDRLRRAGIKVVADERAGAEHYISVRSEWDYLVRQLAPTMFYTIEEIDAATSRIEPPVAKAA